MSITAFLKGGARPMITAHNFAVLITSESLEIGDLHLQTFIVFLNDCFAAIDFNYKITTDQLAADRIPFPENWVAYTFNFNSYIMKPFTEFLVHLSVSMNDLHREHMEKLKRRDSSSSDGFGSCEKSITPMEVFVKFLAIWYKVYRQLEKLKLGVEINPFEEPCAVINFNLLLGVHKLRKEHYKEYPLLHNVCHRLFESSVNGIRYARSHEKVAFGLLDILVKDFDWFYNFSEHIWNFFHVCLNVKVNQKRTQCKILNGIKAMLETFHIETTDNFICKCCNRSNCINAQMSPKQKFTSFINEVVSSEMNRYFYHTIKNEKTERLLICVFSFLLELEKHLPSVDIIQQSFFEVIMAHILNKNPKISSLASAVYIKLMHKKFIPNEILMHIMDFFPRFMSNKSPKNIDSYIQALWNFFPYMTQYRVYVEILEDIESSNFKICFTFHFILSVHGHMQNDFEKYLTEIEYILEFVPKYLQKSNNFIYSGKMLKIFAHTNLEKLEKYSLKCLELIAAVEKYCLGYFANAVGTNYVLVLNIGSQIKRCLKYTKNENQIEVLFMNIYRGFRNIDKELNLLSNWNNATPQQVITYMDNFQKLSILLKLDIYFFDIEGTLFTDTIAELFENSKLNTISKKCNSHLDVFALEIINSCIIKIFNRPNILLASQRQNFTYNLGKVAKYVIDHIKNIEDISKVSIPRFSGYYCALVSLYLICSTKFVRKTFTSSEYTLFLQSLVTMLFEVKNVESFDPDLEIHHSSLRILEDQKLMLKSFITLHSFGNFPLPSYAAWKICIYYGQATQFEDGLKELLLILANKHLSIFIHIIAVIMFNLPKIQPALSEYTIAKCIKAHANLIDKQLLDTSDSAIIKASIILTAFETINKFMQIKEVTSNTNRLSILKHMYGFLQNVNINSGNILTDILKQANGLNNYLLNKDERNSLLDYISKLKHDYI